MNLSIVSLCHPDWHHSTQTRLQLCNCMDKMLSSWVSSFLIPAFHVHIVDRADSDSMHLPKCEWSNEDKSDNRIWIYILSHDRLEGTRKIRYRPAYTLWLVWYCSSAREATDTRLQDHSKHFDFAVMKNFRCWVVEVVFQNYGQVGYWWFNVLEQLLEIERLHFNFLRLYSGFLDYSSHLVEDSSLYYTQLLLLV